VTACSLPGGEPEVISPVDIGDAPTLDPDAERDPCLEGVWTMPTADLDLFVASLVPVPNIRVAGGSLTLTFADGVYDYSGLMTLQVELDMTENQYLQADGIFSSGGAYATEKRSDRGGPVFDFLILDLTASQSEVMVWRAYKNGEVQTAPGTGPNFVIMPPGAANYHCSDSTLEIETQGAAGTIVMFFQRD
jgi:hypothetical protein